MTEQKFHMHQVYSRKRPLWSRMLFLFEAISPRHERVW